MPSPVNGGANANHAHHVLCSNNSSNNATTANGENNTSTDSNHNNKLPLTRPSNIAVSKKCMNGTVELSATNNSLVNDEDDDEYVEKSENMVLLKDEKHKDLLLNRLATLRRNRELCDVVLYAGEREILAHKVVLAALSPNFFELFTPNVNNTAVNTAAAINQQQQQQQNGVFSSSSSTTTTTTTTTTTKSNSTVASATNGFIPVQSTSNKHETSPVHQQPSTSVQPQQQQVVTNGHSAHTAPNAGGQLPSTTASDHKLYCDFNGVDYDCLESLINYAYTGSLEITTNKIADLYKVAYSLRIQNCVKICAQYLAKVLNVQNCIGIRKCANRTNDSLLGNQVDSFIQKNFSEIVQKSTEFTSLPCIQIEIVLSTEDRNVYNYVLKDDRRLGEKIIDRLQQQVNELPEHVEFRMELLTEKTYMLYLDDDLTLHDCCDMDDASSVGSCDLIQDYKKQSRRTSSAQSSSQFNKKNVSGVSSVKNAHVLASPGPKLSRFSSTESMNSLASEIDEVEWKMISVKRNSENYFIMLAIVKRRLAAISLRVKDSPIVKPTLNDRLLLLAKMQETDGIPLTNMVSQRCSVGAVYLNGMLIVCGGYDRGECLKTVEQFDFATNRWTSLAPMLKERGRADACVCNENIYVMGGSDGTRDLSSCECYDSATGLWSKMAPLPLARSNNSAVCVDGQVYCVGGWNGQVAVKTVDRYDPKENIWHSVAPLLTGRYQAGCCEWNGQLIAAGGSDNWNCLNSVEIYDPLTNSWRTLPPMIAPRRGCGACVLNDKLYVSGGSDGTQSLASTEILDLRDPNGVWRPGPPLNAPRGNVRLVTGNNNRIFAVGGFSGKSFLNSIEYLDEGASEWKTYISKPTPLQALTSLEPLSTTIIDEDPVGESQSETPEDNESENGDTAASNVES